MVGNAYPGSPPDIPPDNVRPTEVQALFHAIGSLATCQTQVIELAGDSGMGKTRLLGALAQEASRRGLSVVKTRCSEAERDVPFRVIGDLLDEAALAEPLEWLSAETRSLLGNVMSGPPESPGLDYVVQHSGVCRAMRQVLASSSEGRLILLDDFHWADSASLEFIRHLVCHPVSNPLLIVIAHRPRQAPARLLAALAHGVERDLVHRIWLDPLSPEQSAALVGTALADPRLREWHRLSEGIPLYLLCLAGIEDQGKIPDHLATRMLDEIGNLGAPERVVASAAALLGDECDLASVASVAERSTDVTAAAIGELMVRDVVRPAADSCLAFRHPIVRDLVYAHTDPGWRAAAHRRAAAFLSQRAAPAIKIASHVERAVTGPNTQDVMLLKRAADDALHTSPALAVRWLRMALRIEPENSPPHVELSLSLARALGLTGKLTESRDLMQETLPRVPATPGAGRASAVAFQALVEGLLGNYAEAKAALRTELTAIGTLDVPPRDASTLIIQHGIIGMLDGEFPSREQLDMAHRLALLHGDLVAAGAAQALLGLCLLQEGNASQAASAQLSDGAALIDSSADPQLAAHLEYLGILGWAEALIGRFADAQRHFRRGIRLARRREQLHVLPTMLVGMSGTHLHIGRVSEALKLARDARTIAESINADHIRALAVTLEALGTVLTKGPQKALELAEEAMAALQGASFHWRILVAIALAMAAQLTGAPDRCTVVILEAGGGASLPRVPLAMRPQCYEMLTASSIKAGLPADHWATRAESAAEALDLPVPRAYALIARARVLHAQGDPAKGLSLYQEALGLFAFVGAAGPQAATLIAAAWCAAAASRADAAALMLVLARELAQRSGAVQIESQAAFIQRHLGAAPDAASGKDISPGKDQPLDEGAGPGRLSPEVLEAGKSPSELSALTNREREIAVLAAKGKRTREIAEMLFISPRTVDTHLARIYHKLNINSRVALARLMAESG